MSRARHWAYKVTHGRTFNRVLVLWWVSFAATHIPSESSTVLSDILFFSALFFIARDWNGCHWTPRTHVSIVDCTFMGGRIDLKEEP